MTEPTPYQKLAANLAFMRQRPEQFSKQDIDTEIQKFQQSTNVRNKADRALSKFEKAGAVASKFSSGATFGLLDEAVGAIPFVGEDMKNEQRFLQKQLEEENPGVALASEIAGAVAMPVPFLKGAPRSATKLAKVGRVLAEGALQGAAAGFGNAEGNPLERIDETLKGGTAGAVGAGIIGGATRAARTVGNMADRLGIKAPAVERTMEDIADKTADADIAAGRKRLGELSGRRMGDEAMVVDVLPQGEGALRQAATSNRDVRKRVDTELRERMNRLSNTADDRFSEYTNTPRKSEQRSVAALDEEARTRARPLYKAAEEEATAFDAANPRVRASTVRDMPIRDREGRLQRNLAGVSDDELQREYGRLAELNSAEEALHEGVESSAYRSDYHELPRTERLGKKGQEDLPDADGTVDPEVLAADNRVVSDYNRSQIVRRARAAAMARIDDELAKRPGATDFDFGANVASTPRLSAAHRQALSAQGVPSSKLPKSDAIDEALALPYVQQRIEHLRRAPRSVFAQAADDDHRLLDRVYKDIGEEIRSLPREKWSLKQDFIQQRAILADAITSRAPSYRQALSEFADPMARRESFEAGAQRTPADMIPSELADAADPQMYRQGKAALLRRDVPNLDIGQYARFNDVLAPIATREKAEVFKATFGDHAYNEYARDLLEMAGLQRMKAGGNESTTIDKLMEQLQSEPEAIAGMVSQLLRGNAMAAVAQFSPKGQIGNILDNLRRNKSAGQRADFLMQRGEDKVTKALDQLEQLRREGKIPRPRQWRRPNAASTTARVLGGEVGRP